MNKPKPYIHFTDNYNEGVCIHIGKFLLPLGVFAVGYGLLLIAGLVVFGIIAGVTGNGAWMFGPLFMLGFVVVLALIIGLVALLSWMIRYTARVNR